MYYGEISYEEKDIVKRVDEWQPPDKNKTDLMEQHGLLPEVKVTFVNEGNGSISWVVAKEIPWWRRCGIRVVACAAACWGGFTRCMRATFCLDVAEEIPWWRRCAISVVACAAACWAGFTRCMRVTWEWICGFVRRRCGCGC